MTPDSFLDEHTPELVKLLARLVRVPTVNPPGVDYDRMTGLLAAEMDASGLDVRRFAVPQKLVRETLPADQHAFPRYNVLGVLRTRGAEKTVHFNAHYDVVPVSGTWRHHDPFSGCEENGWVYGRGTGDMKGSMASLLMALRALRACGVNPRMNLEVSFTADEETDSLLGAGWLVKNAPIRPDFAVVMEGGEKEAVCCGHNGVVWVEVVVHGVPAHGSKPQSGVNAFEKMAALVLALEEHKAQLARRTFRSPEGKDMVPTLNVGGVFRQGPGGKINTVPAEAAFSIDRRVLPNESVEKAERELRRFIDTASRRIPNCRVEVRKVSDNHPSYSKPADPFFTAMAEAVTQVRRRAAVFSVSTGFNDMHFFSHHLKIPTLGYGPGGERYHAIDERARISELVKCAKVYARFLTTFSGATE